MTSFAPPSVHTGSMVSRLQALADPNRLRILDALRNGERCVCRLTDSLEMAQPLLSHHLKVLREAGLVSGRKDGRWVHYSIIPDALSEIEMLLAGVREDAVTAGPILDRC
ncbi:MAG: winged helix-turn-helix transcriptional regulator [Gemmatimonadetes bacterium]|nr:winged helix-turn-helix transcriptional regulator [Gemmatimonadota bacterium]